MIPALLLVVATAGPVVGPPSPDDRQYQNVMLGWDAAAKACSVRVNGAEVGDPREDAGRAALLKALPDRSRVINLSGSMDTPFLCMQSIVTVLQSDGRRFRVGFTSEPPPTERP